jgi:hypothetical protein
VVGLNRPVPALPGIPRPYRGRGNRGKVPALPLRDKTGIAGKKKTEQIFTLEQEAAAGVAFAARNCADVAQELKL